MPKERCEEQARLAITAVAARNGVHDARNALDAAKKQKFDTEPFHLALHDAREAEWNAIAALENHKKQHKCWGIAAISFLGGDTISSRGDSAVVWNLREERRFSERRGQRTLCCSPSITRLRDHERFDLRPCWKPRSGGGRVA
jgi:hypothetical protein